MKELLKKEAEKVIPSELEEALIKVCIELIDRVANIEKQVRRIEGRFSICR